MIRLVLVWMASAPSPAWTQWTGDPSGPIYYNGGNVGIGTSTPSKKLEVAKGANVGDGIVISGSNDTRITIGNGQPTVWSWANGWATPGDFSLIEEFVSGSRIYVKPGGNVGIGTTSPQYKLAVNGTIGAQDVIVTNTGWPDYVFRPGYRLRPLNEVGAYIRAHHHLPDIPSEAEVKEKGVSVGEMQAKLLAKIEELTLHMIQAEERGNRLEQQNQELRERLVRLEIRMAASGAPAASR